MHYGVDLSSNNVHPLNYQAIYDHLASLGAGARPFAVVKITEGTTYVNPDAATDIAGLHAVGFAIAGYLMDHGSADPATEESFYIRNAGGLVQTDDIELPDGLTPVQYAAHVAQLITQAPTALIYLNQSEVAEGILQGAGLWLAQYNGQPGVTAYPCVMHQYSDAGTIPNNSGTFDLNAWCGTEAQFAQFFKITTQEFGMAHGHVNGKTHVFGVGSDGILRSRVQADGATSWELEGTNATLATGLIPNQTPDVQVREDGSLHAYVLNTTNALVHCWLPFNATTWQSETPG